MGQRRIGLTGGIATGKSTVANYLAITHGLPILDADRYAREAVQPGSEILNQIIQRYGRHLLQPEGNLDRQQLGHVIFADITERRWLESQIHPYVSQCFDRDIQRLTESHRQHNPSAHASLDNTLVLVIPLLFEANLSHRVTETWVVSCTVEQQLMRLMQRDQLTESQARNRTAAQMPMAEKCALADVVLDNSGSQAALLQQVETALHHLLSS